MKKSSEHAPLPCEREGCDRGAARSVKYGDERTEFLCVDHYVDVSLDLDVVIHEVKRINYR